MKHIIYISLLVSLLFVIFSSSIGFKMTHELFYYLKIKSPMVQPQSLKYTVPHALLMGIITFIILYAKYLKNIPKAPGFNLTPLPRHHQESQPPQPHHPPPPSDEM